jgi:hypothetical protein
MAWGSKKREELIAELAASKKETEILRELLSYKEKELERLRESLRITQDALIAKEAPVAYIDQRDAREDAKRTELSLEERERREQARAQAEMDKLLLEELEAPLFKSADDMQQILSRPFAASTVGEKSLHNDGES